MNASVGEFGTQGYCGGQVSARSSTEMLVVTRSAPEDKKRELISLIIREVLHVRI